MSHVLAAGCLVVEWLCVACIHWLRELRQAPAPYRLWGVLSPAMLSALFAAAASMFLLVVFLGAPSRYPVPDFVWIVPASAVVVIGFLILQLVITLRRPRLYGTPPPPSIE